MSVREVFRSWTKATVLLACLDAVYIFLAYAATTFLTMHPEMAPSTALMEHAGIYTIFLAFWCWAAIDRGLWETRSSESLFRYLPLIIRAVTSAMVFSVFVTVSIVDHPVHREFLATFCIITMVAIPLFRSVLHGAVMLLRHQGYYGHSVLVVGANPRSANIVAILRSHPRHGYRVEGFLEDDEQRRVYLQKLDVPCLGGFKDLRQVLGEKKVDEVQIVLPVRSLSDVVDEMARICDECGVPAHFLADLFPLKIAKSNLMYMEDIPLVSLSTIPESPGELALKRALDLAVSSILLMALLPVFLVTAIAIKLDSSGPVFFLQDRAGRNGRRFKMIKFRSMGRDAEKMRAALEKFNQVDGPAFKMKDDPRVTRVGRFIRKYSIDELPQLINVWVGEMSLVGPRPPLMHHAEQYTWDQRRRLSVKPGMTGLWQVSGRSDVGFEEWLEMDLSYIDTWSITQDLLILLKTFPAVIRGRGAV